jgi:hypothetical protein
MNTYCYKFHWIDKLKQSHVKYLYAPSLADVKIMFKDVFGFEPKAPQVIITRLTGAEN